MTGSTGAGRSPIAGTHHPLRHGDLYAYGALTHRHGAEISALARAATGRDGASPSSRTPGLSRAASTRRCRRRSRSRSIRRRAVAALRGFYDGRPFVRVLDEPPRLKDVVASNYAHLSAVADGGTIVVMSVIDNLVKGAAGGAMQWMNRLQGFGETDGLAAPAPGWT